MINGFISHVGRKYAIFTTLQPGSVSETSGVSPIFVKGRDGTECNEALSAGSRFSAYTRRPIFIVRSLTRAVGLLERIRKL